MLNIPKGFVDQNYSDQHPYEVELAHVGQGNWRAFRSIGIDLLEVISIAREWARELAEIERPWLCWNVDDDWLIIQQKLIKSVGWTPLIGFDPRVGAPKRVLPGTIVFDFNKNLGLPILYPHFPLEFSFLFCKKIAFWHSDILIREGKIKELANIFENLRNGETAATRYRLGLRDAFSTKNKRYWELVGCTTEKASEEQFYKGCGWWMDYWAHPNGIDGKSIKSQYYWDHGSGIYYWNKKHKGNCVLLNEKTYREGHFTKIAKKDYSGFHEAGSMSDARREMASEIKENFDLVKACNELGLANFLIN